jgi:hypothetical protein
MAQMGSMQREMDAATVFSFSLVADPVCVLP